MKLPARIAPPLAGELSGEAALGARAPAAASARNDELRRVAEEFEAMLLAEMFAPMFAGLDSDGLGGGGAGERMFRPMLVQEYSAAMARAGGVGVADAIMRELSAIQAGADGSDR